MKQIDINVHDNDLRLLKAVRDAKVSDIEKFVCYVHVTQARNKETLIIESQAALDAVCLIRLLERMIAGAKEVDETEQPF